MNVPYCLLKYLPYYDYICPKCRKEVKRNSHKCVHCGERYGVPIRVPPYVLKELQKGNPKPAEQYVHKHVFPRVSASERTYLTQFFTEIFSDGFECPPNTAPDTFTAWTAVTNAPTIVSDQAKTGTYSEFADANNEYVSKTFTTGTTLFARWYIRLNQVPPNNYGVGLGALLTSADADVWTLHIKQIGWVVKWYLSTPLGVYEWTNTPAINTWICAEVKYVQSTTVGEYRLYVDSAEVITQTGLNINRAGAKIQVGAMYTDWHSSQRAWYDSVVLADAYIGPISEETIQSVSDSLTLADVVDVVSPNKIVADALAIAESVLVHKELKIADTLSLADLIAGSFGYLFKIGLETGNLSEFDAQEGTQSVVSTQKHHGTYSLETSTGYSSVFKNVSEASAEKWLLFAYRFSRRLTGSQEIVFVGASASSEPQWNLTLVGDGAIGLCQIAVYKSTDPPFEVKWWIGDGDFEPNEWHIIKIRHKSGSGNAEIDLYVDDMDTPKLSFTDVTFETPAIYQFGDLDNAGEGNYTGWHDCIGLTLTDSGDLFEEGAPPAGQQLFTLINEMEY